MLRQSFYPLSPTNATAPNRCPSPQSHKRDSSPKKQGSRFYILILRFYHAGSLPSNSKHGIITQAIKIIVIGGRQIIHKGAHLLRGFFRSKEQIVVQILEAYSRSTWPRPFKEFGNNASSYSVTPTRISRLPGVIHSDPGRIHRSPKARLPKVPHSRAHR